MHIGIKIIPGGIDLFTKVHRLTPLPVIEGHLPDVILTQSAGHVRNKIEGIIIG